MIHWVEASEVEVSEPESEGWDERVAASSTSGFMQSLAWSRFKVAEGFERRLLTLSAGGTRYGVASVLRFPGDGFSVCPEGPALPWEDTETCRRALKALVEEVRQGPSVGLRIEPRLEKPGPRFLKNWSRSPVDLNPEHTLVVSLDRSDEELLAAMHPKARYNLRLSQRHGVEVTQSRNPNDTRRFYELFQETALRNGFFAEPFPFFLNLASHLMPSGTARFLFASAEDKELAAMVLITFGPRATYLYGASSGEGRNRMPNHAMHWAAMQIARAEGCTEYDLYGYDPFEQPNHLYAGISRFKKQWGGERRSWIGGRDYLLYDRIAEKMVAALSQQ